MKSGDPRRRLFEQRAEDAERRRKNTPFVAALARPGDRRSGGVGTSPEPRTENTRRGAPAHVARPPPPRGAARHFFISKKTILTGVLPVFFMTCLANGGADMGAGMPVKGLMSTGGSGFFMSPPGKMVTWSPSRT